MKKISKWPAFLDMLRSSETLRCSSRELDVHVSTTFRWRHAILSAMRLSEAIPLTGTIELKEISFAASRKGSRDVSLARHRGARDRGWQWYLVGRDRVLLARSRSGVVHAATVGSDVAVMDDLRRMLIARLTQRCTIIGRMPRAGPHGAIIRTAGHEYVTPKHASGLGTYDIHHLRNIDAYARRLLSWLDRFRGVASRYRDNYLLWHRVVDCDHRLIWVHAAIISSLGVLDVRTALARSEGRSEACVRT